MPRLRNYDRLPPISRLQRFFTYDPVTGDLVWRENRRPRIHAGDLAGSVNNRGQVVVGVDNDLFAASHIIWALQTGRWPDHAIYFRDGNAQNLVWRNLSPKRPSRSRSRSAIYARHLRDLNRRAQEVVDRDPDMSTAWRYGSDDDRRRILREARGIVRHYDRNAENPNVVVHPGVSPTTLDPDDAPYGRL